MPNLNMVNSEIPVFNNEDYNISKEELQQGIPSSEELVSKMQICMKRILPKKEGDGIKFYNSQWTHRVFELDTNPRLIFKMNSYAISKDSPLNDRYQNMIYAQTVIRTHQLGLLVIPNAKLFTVDLEGKKYEIIAEQKMDINPHESAQEQYFLDYADSLNETIRQLALFICKTGYSDVEWRNNPILNNSFDGRNRKIALIDLEEMRNAKDGLFGGAFGRRGLVGCVNEEQGKFVKIIAEENHISTSLFADAYSLRKKELEEGRKLKEYYVKKEIIEGNEPIKIEENALGFSTDSEKAEKLKQLALHLIEAINIKIANSSIEESIRGRRYIYIDTNRGTFLGMDSRLVDPGENEYETARAFKTDEEYYEATFLGSIVKKLQDLSCIYKLAKRNGHGYYIQA